MSSFSVNVAVKPKMATVKLASGYEMPLVGFGLWKIPQEETADTVYAAIKAGYRLFDGAYDYQNEKQAGEGIRRALKEGLVTREEIFITTKLWNNYHRKEHVEQMAKVQNDSWGLGYIDLYLIHFPVAQPYIPPYELAYPAWWTTATREAVALDKVPIRETWTALESLVDSGLARSIGVSNFSTQSLYDMLTYNRHPISALQIEHHPYLTQETLVTMAQEEGIAVTAYSSFGPASFEGMDGIFGDTARATGLLFTNPTITKIAKSHGKAPAQVLLRWATQRNIAVIPKSTDKKRLAENLDVTSGWELTSQEIQDISALDKGLRFNDPGFYLARPIRIFG